ncbi:NAD-capped RNA hydrolase NUDT12 isoform X1 [Ahaetulla prasina]|uniref:NAD-capped RNA hydrolase NUDT12 isoform X1 n=1 Tax=Ahaetulla prasina TaxID=499056 RepID=UPI002646FEEB|nr:NAD-capped RNA hydrolase NUDT12 isoform X1 [Ahaetulla prasina]
MDVPDTYSVALNWEKENASCQENMKDCTKGKDFYKEMAFSEFSYSTETPQENYSSQEIYFRKNYNKEMSNALQIRNNSLFETGTAMLISSKESKNIRRYSFPVPSIDVLSLPQLRRDSGFYSMPSLSLKLLSIPFKVVTTSKMSTNRRVSYTKPYSSFTSLSGTLTDLKSSRCYAFASCDHDMNVCHTKQESKFSNTFSEDNYLEYRQNRKETGQVTVEDFHSIMNSCQAQKEKYRYIETPTTPKGGEEDITFEKDSFVCEEVLRSKDQQVQVHEKLPNKVTVNQDSLLSEKLSSGNSNNNISAKLSVEDIQGQESVMQSNENLLQSIFECKEMEKNQRKSVMTVITGELEEKPIILGDIKSMANSFGLAIKKDPSSKRETVFMLPLLDTEESNRVNEFQNCSDIQKMSENIPEDSDCQDYSIQTEHLLAGDSFTDAPEMLSSEQHISLSHHSGSHLVDVQTETLFKSSSEKRDEEKEANMNVVVTSATFSSVNQTDQIAKSLKDTSTGLSRDPVLKDARTNNSSQEEEERDQWARRRKWFKNSKRHPSFRKSSKNSRFTRGSMNSEDGCPLDLGPHRESEERGFYTEMFHSASWVFQGDDANADNNIRCLSKRPVTIRERTVRIPKGMGDYPWGFQIQFSKPILVTKVDSNSTAEEAGLQIGDIVMAVNGTDVTSMPHSEAANLVKKGPDILNLLVGSDISRCPNIPRPTCRGYLHKQTHSGILKGWRKRWFVLKHDGSLYYYKHKKDEGKCRPLEVTKVEGAEIGMDNSLGKPFAFKCVPRAGNRVFYFRTTSAQEMKRWVDNMEKAAHPIHQNHVWEDVTMHNTSLPPLAIKNPECLGLLHQLDKTKNIWVQHYCILKDGCLYFYASIRSTHAVGGIYLQGYTVGEQSLGSRRSVIEVKPPSEEFTTFYLCAESVNENQRWISALRASVSKWLPWNKATEDFMH